MMNNPPNEILRAFEPVTPENAGLSESSLALMRQTLASFPSVQRALLFGSRAKGNFHLGSDVDIALEGSSTLTTMDIAGVMNAGAMNFSLPIVNIRTTFGANNPAISTDEDAPSSH